MSSAASLARPGGNVTGFSNYVPLILSEWLQILKQMAPQATRLQVVWHPATTPSTDLGSLVETTAKAFAVRVTTTTQ